MDDEDVLRLQRPGHVLGDSTALGIIVTHDTVPVLPAVLGETGLVAEAVTLGMRLLENRPDLPRLTRERRADKADDLVGVDGLLTRAVACSGTPWLSYSTISILVAGFVALYSSNAS